MSSMVKLNIEVDHLCNEDKHLSRSENIKTGLKGYTEKYV